MDIEEIYQNFYKENLDNNNYIDFIGINISSSSQKQFLFKTYKHIGTVIEHYDPFLSLLKSKDMIKNYIPIISSDVNRVQYDVRLDNRNNKNMSDVLSCLNNNLHFGNTFSHSVFSEIEYLSKMNITSLSGYDMSALYFVGLQWKEGKLSALKSHFITRKVKNTSHFSEGFWYEDEYFLLYFKLSKNKLCEKLSIIAADIINQLEGHLWMFGIDAFNDSNIKYKIYFQNKNGFNMVDIFRILNQYNEFSSVCIALNQLTSWLMGHPELSLYGFAITVTKQERYGLNLYFIPPLNLRGTT